MPPSPNSDELLPSHSRLSKLVVQSKKGNHHRVHARGFQLPHQTDGQARTSMSSFSPNDWSILSGSTRKLLWLNQGKELLDPFDQLLVVAQSNMGNPNP
jgi:hypothetical protein